MDGSARRLTSARAASGVKQRLTGSNNRSRVSVMVVLMRSFYLASQEFECLFQAGILPSCLLAQAQKQSHFRSGFVPSHCSFKGQWTIRSVQVSFTYFRGD